MELDPLRTRAARAASERALVRVVHHYDARPEFVVLGGLVPELLCARSGLRHAGTTDVDVQVDLEIAAGAINAVRLEQALHMAEFAPLNGTVWRWVDGGRGAHGIQAVVKFELLADLTSERAESTVRFLDCEQLGAVNLRGTGYAARDVIVQSLSADIDGTAHTVEVNVTGPAGFLLAKASAAHSRRKPKDWYDLAFVLLHNDLGGPEQAAAAVAARFPDGLTGSVRTALDDLLGNFATPTAQGPQAYAEQMLVDHPEFDSTTLASDAMLAVGAFHRALFPAGRPD